MKKLVLNNKIIVLMPRASNKYLQLPIVLLNNNKITIEDFVEVVLDEKYQIAVLVSKSNKSKTSEDIFYFPIKNEIINDFLDGNFNEVIINNGYLDNFTETESIALPIKIKSKTKE